MSQRLRGHRRSAVAVRTAAAAVVLALIGTGLPTTAEEPPTGRSSARIARATWDTGWFQADVLRELPIELGYQVDAPHSMENKEFYRAVAAGEVDLWANGWFPLHDPYFDEVDTHGGATSVGYEMRQGALQGYLVDSATAERLGIDSLDDHRDPGIAAEFDADGDGRAES